MCVKIHVEKHQMSLRQTHGKFLDLKCVGMVVFVRILLPPIQIIPSGIHAHVPPAYSVRVDHGYTFEHEVVPQFLGVVVVTF